MEHHRTVIAGEDVESRVKKILIEHLGVEVAAVTPDALLVPKHDLKSRIIGNDPHLGADSLDIVELVMAFEEEFRIEITDDEAEPLNDATVQGLIDFVAGKVAAKAAKAA